MLTVHKGRLLRVATKYPYFTFDHYVASSAKRANCLAAHLRTVAGVYRTHVKVQPLLTGYYLVTWRNRNRTAYQHASACVRAFNAGWQGGCNVT